MPATWVQTLKEVGGIVGEVSSFITIVEKVTKVMDESLSELTEAEAEISSVLFSDYREALRECCSTGKGYLDDCRLLLKQWTEFRALLKTQLEKSQVLPQSLLSKLHDLCRMCSAIINDFLEYKEKLGAALKEATALESRCKSELDKAKSSRSSMYLMLAVGGVIALLSGGVGILVALGVVTGSAVALGIAAGAGAAVSYSAYNRIGRVGELIADIRKHHGALLEDIEELNTTADKIEDQQQLVKRLAREMEEALRQAELAQSEEEEEQMRLERLGN